MNPQNHVSTRLTIPPSFLCFSGMVVLYRFIMAPPPGSPVGVIRLVNGVEIPIRPSSQPMPPGAATLADVDGSFATLCGPLAWVGEQYVLDVRIVNPARA